MSEQQQGRGPYRKRIRLDMLETSVNYEVTVDEDSTDDHGEMTRPMSEDLTLTLSSAEFATNLHYEEFTTGNEEFHLCGVEDELPISDQSLDTQTKYVQGVLIGDGVGDMEETGSRQDEFEDEVVDNANRREIDDLMKTFQPIFDYSLHLSDNDDNDNPDDCDHVNIIIDEDDLDIYFDAMTDREENCHEHDDYDTVSADIDECPLYDGAKITVGAVMLMLALFTSKYNISSDGIQQLLSILSLILPNSHRLCTTLFAFKSYFKHLKNPLVFHYFCPNCFALLEDRTLSKCPNTCCQQVLSVNTVPYFLEIPIIHQIQNLFSINGFYGSLQGRFKHQFGKYCDIYDGQLYKSLFTNGGPLHSPDNISFVFNTDGAPVFKSSKVSIWPIFMIINELDYRQRMKKENMLLAGLWFGTSKPAMGTFLKPFLDMTKVFEKGINCYAPGKGDFICHGYLLCGTADLPARSLLCNNVQYNGSFSCWHCMQRGETAKSGKGHAHVFPFKLDSPKGPERTRDDVINNAKEAIRCSTRSKLVPVNGIKGPTWLLFCPLFNIIHGIAIDYMHGVLLGVQKLLLRLWFSSTYARKSFSINEHVEKVDKRLLSIRPTLAITRLPRSIQNDLQHWKASEFRSFLLYYGGPVLYGILDEARFSHYLLLVEALYILLKLGSSEEEVCQAEKMLFQFCKDFDIFYDKCYMTLNIHQLLHLPDSVRNLGPLFTHSCFPFEDKNGLVLKMIRGTQNIDSQIVTGISFVQKLPELKHKCISSGSIEAYICESIEQPNILKRKQKLGLNSYVLGGMKERILKTDEFTALSLYLGEQPVQDKFLSFNRMELKRDIIYGTTYSRMTKRDNSVIMFQSVNNSRFNFGRVRYFIQLVPGNGTVVAFVDRLECISPDKNSHIKAVRECENVDVVSLQQIVSSCMYVTLPDAASSFVCLFPNNVESD